MKKKHYLVNSLIFWIAQRIKIKLNYHLACNKLTKIKYKFTFENVTVDPLPLFLGGQNYFV